jgi:hypothetical protein
MPLSNTTRNYELTGNYHTEHPLQLSSLPCVLCPMFVWVVQPWTLSIYFLTFLNHSLHDPGNFIGIFLLVAYSKPFLGLSSFILKRFITHLPLSHLKLFVSYSVPFLVFILTLKKRCLNILRFYFDRMQKKKVAYDVSVALYPYYVWIWSVLGHKASSSLVRHQSSDADCSGHKNIVMWHNWSCILIRGMQKPKDEKCHTSRNSTHFL